MKNGPDCQIEDRKFMIILHMMQQLARHGTGMNVRQKTIIEQGTIQLGRQGHCRSPSRGPFTFYVPETHIMYFIRRC